MKKLFCLLFFVAITVASFAQSVTPRYGTAKNQDNTGRVLTYNYLSVTDATGADSTVSFPNAYQTTYTVSMRDSLTFKQPNVTTSYATDKIEIIAIGASGTILKFYGSYWKSSGSATLSTNGRAVVDFVFDGTYWVETNRNVQ
jgi:hypothetical protein